MAITVRDALRIGGLVEARVLAGKRGLDNVIRAVDIIDVPDAAIWFRRDSLLSTTFYALKDNIEAQLQMLEDIASCGGAALIIFSPERYISYIDHKLIEKADQLNLPLLQMPDCSYIDVIVPVMSQILDKQVQALEYAHEVHTMMTDIVLKGSGLKELLTSLAALLRHPVIMADADLAILDVAIPAGYKGKFPSIIKAIAGQVSKPHLDSFYPPGLITELIRNKVPAYYDYGSGKEDFIDFFFPIFAGDTLFGILIIPHLEERMDKSKTVATEAGAMAIALHILKEKAIRDTQRKNALDFYNELLLGNIKNRENIISRARQFGLDATGSYYVILVELNKESVYCGRGQGSNRTAAIDELERKLYRLLHYSLEAEQADGVVVEALGSLIILVHLSEKLSPPAAREFGKELMLKIKKTVSTRMNGIPIYMAAGDHCPDIERISTSYLEAWETLDLGKKLYQADFALTHMDMISYHLVKRFLTSINRPNLYEQVYAPLVNYDTEKSGELVLTLEKYIECNFSRTRTAEKMHIHRNSLNYRLQKIEELLGKNLEAIDTFPLLLASISHRLST